MGSFRPNGKGIQEVCKSAGMQAALLAAAEKLAAGANARASGHEKALRITEFKAPPYAAHVDVLTRTAVGAARIGQVGAAQRAHQDVVHDFGRPLENGLAHGVLAGPAAAQHGHALAPHRAAP